MKYVIVQKLQKFHVFVAVKHRTQNKVEQMKFVINQIKFDKFIKTLWF